MKVIIAAAVLVAQLEGGGAQRMLWLAGELLDGAFLLQASRAERLALRLGGVRERVPMMSDQPADGTLRWTDSAGLCFAEFTPMGSNIRVERASFGCQWNSRQEAIIWLAAALARCPNALEPSVQFDDAGEIVAVSIVRAQPSQFAVEVQLIEVTKGWEGSITLTAGGPRAVLAR